MCFSQEMSFSFAALGLVCSIFAYYRTKNFDLFLGIFYFFTMELLQGIQYFYINECGEGPRADINRYLTIAGFLHICFQPYFTHVMNGAFARTDITRAKFTVIKRLGLIGGTLLFSRFLMAPYYSTMDISAEGPCGISTEWLRGEKLCTFKGNYHLAWSVPMADPTYNIQGSGIHSFLMFAPFFVFKPSNWLQGTFLYLTGPFLASWVTSNLMEQASIWCFFSIAQICFMMLANWREFFGSRKESATNGKAQNGASKKVKAHSE